MFSYLVYSSDIVVYIRVWKTFPRLLYLDERCDSVCINREHEMTLTFLRQGQNWSQAFQWGKKVYILAFCERFVACEL